MVPHHRFGSRLAIRPRNLPSSSSRLRRGYDRAPRGAVSFCRFRTLARSPACVALKIRCRSRRTLSSLAPPVDGVPVEHVLRSVHHVAPASSAAIDRWSSRHRRGANLPFGSGVRWQSFVKGSPGSRQHPFGSRHQARYPASYTRTTAVEGPVTLSAVSCCLSAAGIRFLGILSRQGIRPPLRSAYRHAQRACRTLTGFPCSTRMRHDRGWVPSIPRGRRCPHGQAWSLIVACHITAACPCLPGITIRPGE